MSDKTAYCTVLNYHSFCPPFRQQFVSTANRQFLLYRPTDYVYIYIVLKNYISI